MIDIKMIREQPDLMRQALQKRQLETDIIDHILKLDEQRRKLTQEVEALKAHRNAVSKEISNMRSGKEQSEKIEGMREVGNHINRLDTHLHQLDREFTDLVATIPNIPDLRAPIGREESENVVIFTSKELKQFDFPPMAHWDLGPKLGIIDFEQGIKITGSRFYVLSGAGARLQRALISWMLDLHIRQGYTEKYLPFMVKEEVLFGSGQLPKFRDNLYHDYEEDLWMVPTAEVPLTGIMGGAIIDENLLPLNYVAYTPCFRREKMSAGRDVRGIKRGHQFDKVEMYKFCIPEESDNELEKMRSDAEQTCEELGLTYRVKKLCTGDLGFAAKFTYDLEAWAPGCQEWLEVSSISNVGDFQARRSNIRYRPRGEKARLMHTLNGSGLGLPRTLIAVLENYQQEDGSIIVPEVLRPWMGGIKIISKSTIP